MELKRIAFFCYLSRCISGRHPTRGPAPLEFNGRHRSSGEEPLHLIAAKSLERCQFGRSFDTFGHDRHAERVGNIDDDLHEGRTRVAVKLRDQNAVNLHDISGEVPQHHHRGAARPEVVDRDPDTETAQLIQLIGHPWHIGEEGRLGDFDDEALGRDPTNEQCVADVIHQAAGGEVATRDVDGEIGVAETWEVLPCGERGDCFRQHVATEVADHARPLGDRDEHRRGHRATTRAIPTSERLHTGEIAGEVDNRLVVQLDGLAVDGIGKRLLELGVCLEPLAHGVVERRDASLAELLSLVNSNVCVAQEVKGVTIGAC